jgi:methylglutaconyl-CoA hydratase
LTKQIQKRTYAAASQASPIRLQNHPAPHSGTIRVLLLDRPEARNALSRQLMTELRRHVDEIKAEGDTGGTRALVIASNVDKAFCAGADLKERRGMSQDE